MKKQISAAALLLALSVGSAAAADLPSRKGPVYVPPPPPPLWTGFYVGLNAGYGFNQSDNVTTLGGPILVGPGANGVAFANALGASSNSIVPLSLNGFIGGGQVGYNWQLGERYVIGLEADIQGLAGASNSGSVTGFNQITATNLYAATATASKSLDYLGTVRARVGFLFTPTLLVYATGGLAYGGTNLSTSFLGSDTLGTTLAASGSSSYSDTGVGWTVGGGLEWLFQPRWSAKVEYLYYDLGSVSPPGSVLTASTPAGVALGAAATQISARFNGQVIRAGLNYHFNWGAPAPVVAKY
jgi:outer membrane immunogenic protein